MPVSFERVRAEHDVLHPRADVRRERAEVDDAEVAVPERGLRGAPLERDVAVDERVLELLARELVELGRSSSSTPVTLPRGAVQPKYGTSPITCSSRRRASSSSVDAELVAQHLVGVLAERRRGPVQKRAGPADMRTGHVG